MFSSTDRARLFETFGPESSGSASLGLTGHGIWHPTPLDVLLPGLEAVLEAGWLGGQDDPSTVLDAGSGDGRLVAALSLISGLSHAARILGLESSAPLVAQAHELLEQLDPKRPAQIARGDFLEPASYSALGIRARDIDTFLSYPDGCEHELARFIVREAPEAALIVLSPDRSFRLPELGLRHSLKVSPTGGPTWTAHRFGAA